MYVYGELFMGSIIGFPAIIKYQITLDWSDKQPIATVFVLFYTYYINIFY